MRREARDVGAKKTIEEEALHDEAEQEDEGETRCICGEVDPPDDSGLYIQCEECSVWQHGYCVGITEGETPDKYWCEQCKPELHSLYRTESKEQRSLYKPTQQSRRKFRRSKRNSESEGDIAGQGQGQGLAADVSGLSQRLSRQQRHMLSEGIKETEEEGSPEGEALAQGQTKGKAGVDEYDYDGEQRVPDRKRATSSAREEKHYQLMLEKALRESRRTSNDGNAEDGEEALKLEDANRESIDANEKEAREPESPKTDPSETHIPSMQPRKRSRTANKSTSPSESDEDAKRKRSRKGKGNASAPPASRPTKNASGKPGRTPKSQGSKNSGSSGSAKSGGSSIDIGINKPLKPRIPSQRTTLHEMRKRVSAILEYISRTQLELSEDQIQKDQLCQFVENEMFLNNINKIFSSYDDSFKTMDELTRKLLLWEQKYNSIN